jgi:phage gp45-like
MAMTVDIKADLPGNGSMEVSGGSTLKSMVKQVGKK